MNLTNNDAKRFLHRIRVFLSSKGQLGLYEEFSQWFFIQPKIIASMERSVKENVGLRMDYYYVDFIREILGREDRGGKSKKQRFNEYRTVILLERGNRSPEECFNAKIDLEFLVEILDLEERVAILMTLHGYDQKEIAATLGKVESRANQHLKSAKRKIRQYVKFRELQSESSHLS